MNPPLMMMFVLSALTTPVYGDTTAGTSPRGFLEGAIDKLDNYLDENANRRRQIDIERARIVSKGALPEIIIRRSGVNEFEHPYFLDGLLFNGERIKLKNPISRAIEVFGSDYRIAEGRYIWDQLGLSVLTWLPNYRETDYLYIAEDDDYVLKPDVKREKYIRTIIITLNLSPSTVNVEPLYTFKGYLELDGAGINTQSKLWEVEALTDRKGMSGATFYIICSAERASCKVDNLGDEPSDDITFHTDKDHRNGKIYAISFSL